MCAQRYSTLAGIYRDSWQNTAVTYLTRKRLAIVNCVTRNLQLINTEVAAAEYCWWERFRVSFENNKPQQNKLLSKINYILSVEWTNEYFK